MWRVQDWASPWLLEGAPGISGEQAKGWGVLERRKTGRLRRLNPWSARQGEVGWSNRNRGESETVQDTWSRWQPCGGPLPGEGLREGKGEAGGPASAPLPGVSCPPPPHWISSPQEATGARKAAAPREMLGSRKGPWPAQPPCADSGAGGAQGGPISQPVPVKIGGGDGEAKPFIKL